MALARNRLDVDGVRGALVPLLLLVALLGVHVCWYIPSLAFSLFWTCSADAAAAVLAATVLAALLGDSCTALASASSE
jgi:hypothetical protein